MRASLLTSDPTFSKHRMVLYYEPEYNRGYNGYLGANYSRIVRFLRNVPMDFVFLPKTLENRDDFFAYNLPNVQGAAQQLPADSQMLLRHAYLQIEQMLPSQLLYSPSPLLIIVDPYDDWERPKNSPTVPCRIINLKGETADEARLSMEHYLPMISREFTVRFSLYKAPGDSFADYEAIDEIAKEIQERIHRLSAMGVSDIVIQSLIQLPKPEHSKLLVTSDYRILLPNYGDMEIVIPPLSKVLYFFYLKHPEGVLFKQLRHHKQELAEIYSNISHRENIERMNDSINSLVDTTTNSVNEKCSRIRAAFVSRFTDSLAKDYYISGFAGEPKVITLDRSLLVDQTNLNLK